MTVKAPPYPPDTRSKGWRFELDVERMEKSGTWRRAKRNDVRAAAMFLWVASWTQRPCGSLPNDEEDLELLVGFPEGFFAEHRAIIMRGWYVASDGLLYHPVITEMVIDMANRRASEAKRKADWRAKMEAQRNGPTPGAAPPPSPTSDASVPRDKGGRDDTGTGTGTGTGLRERDKHQGTDALSPSGDAQPESGGEFKLNGHAYLPPDCPHAKVVALWAEVLPELPQPLKWTGQRVEHLKVRWRELAVEKQWRSETEGLAYFRKVFHFVRKSPFLLGKKTGRNGRAFTLELPWLIRPENFLKTLEGKYHEDSA